MSYTCAKCGENDLNQYGHWMPDGTFSCDNKPNPKKEKPMAKSTHWIHAALDMESLPETMCTDPDVAAKYYLTDLHSPLDQWEDREYLMDDGHVDIHLIGLTETTDIIEDEDEQFDGYEPGQMWYKKTGEKATVRVSLKFEVIDSTVEKFGGDK